MVIGEARERDWMEIFLFLCLDRKKHNQCLLENVTTTKFTVPFLFVTRMVDSSDRRWGDEVSGGLATRSKP
jgi:hypothetical protein